jgi:RNA-binding protein NOB1
VSTKAAPPGSSELATVQVHLKPNFQYRNRGTVYSIPAPKAGTAKGGKGSQNLILREDQTEFQRGMKTEAVRARKEQKKISSALAAAAVKDGDSNATRSWADPDWMPDMMLGKTSKNGSALPDIGFGRRNPNEVRKKKK